MEIYSLPASFGGDPEALAFLQAFYSRSTESIVSRVERLGGANEVQKVRDKLKQFYINYGHASIGECGNVTLFIEGVSILAAKAVEDDPLFVGQECSTRYIDMNTAGQYNDGTDASRWWKNQYKKVLELLEPAVLAAHPFEPDTIANLGKVTASAQTIHNNACRARAFDIARAWLPCDTLTNLSWTTSFRNAAAATTRLLSSPLQEVRELAVALRHHLVLHWPSGIVPFTELELKTADWLQNVPAYEYPKPYGSLHEAASVVYTLNSSFQFDLGAVNDRPRGAPLPVQLAKSMTFNISGKIDYASWRDMQRHRRNIGVSPTPKSAPFHSWYFKQLEQYLTADQIHFIAEAVQHNTKSGEPHEMPMGVLVPYHYELDLGQAIYFAELRSGQTTHSTLRPVAQAIARQLERMNIKVYADYSESKFDVRRGKQTIFEQQPQANQDQ